jgi:hypothetical protein
MRFSAHASSAIALTVLLSTHLIAAEWKQVTNPPSSPGTMVLLTDGEVMTLASNDQVWMRLSPDVQGDYSSGSWRFTAPMSMRRLYLMVSRT